MNGKAMATVDYEEYHDFLEETKWLVFVEGFGDSKSRLYFLYILGIYAWNSFILLMAVYGCWLAVPNKELVIIAFHVFLIALFALWGLTARVVTRGSLSKTREMIREQFYRYEEEEDDETILNLKKVVVDTVRTRNRQFSLVVVLGALSNLIFFPITQVFLVTEEEYENSVDLANPYFPHYLYLPWSTRPRAGLLAGFFLNVFLLVFIYGMAIVMNEIYISCTLQLAYQLRILNHSIRTIHTRALRVYQRRYKASEERAMSNLLETQEFQDCVYACLVNNIKHHQVLIRFHECCMPFIGSCFLLITLIASCIFASILYLIIKNPPWNCMINYVVTLMTEQTYCFYFCYFGEQVLEQSSRLYESIYSMSWMDYDRRFTRSLQIFMIKNRKPMRIKAHLLNFAACVESYGDFITAMYKIMNLLRQSDKPLNTKNHNN